MNDFHPGTKVLLVHNDIARVGTVRETTTVDGTPGAIVTTTAGPVFAEERSLTILPQDTPMFRVGDMARVRADSPQHAGRYGTVASPEFHGDLFGFWVYLDHEYVWIPADALSVVRIGGVR